LAITVQNNSLIIKKSGKMRSTNTFGIHFVLRENRGKNGLSGYSAPYYTSDSAAYYTIDSGAYYTSR